MKRRIRRLLDLLHLFETAVAGLALLLLVGLVMGQIVARNFFDTGIPGADVLSRHLLLYILFFGAALATDADRHIRIDLLTAWLPSRLLDRLYRPLLAVGACVLALLTHAAWRFWLDSWEYSQPQERWTVLLDLVIPFGFGLLTFHFLMDLVLGTAARRSMQ
ncbi:MAG: TRAP transporter small permease [Gammaproteobacteria bacterium]|nr:MAG: TRAP transporter small permease [Gammaproteobacteria bacterium]